jgi:HlyD family secretion protein
MSGQQGKNKFKNGVQWLTWSGALALVSIGGWLTSTLVLNRLAEPVMVRLLTVGRGTVETTINESGIVELRGQQTLKSPTEGAVDRVLVRPGHKIRPGQALVTLRYPERQIALANQQVQIQQQQFILARNRQKIVEAQEQLRADERELRKLAVLAVEGAVAQQQVQEQEDRVRNARATLRDAQAAARTAALELRSFQLKRQPIQQQLQDTVVTAPLDGVVLGVNVKDGDGVQLRTDLLTLGDPRQILVKLQLSTLNATRVQANQFARVSVIGPDAQTFTGRVQSFYPQAVTTEENQRQSSRNKSAQPTVPATVRLDTPTRMLIPGSMVNVEIVLKKRQNVMVLNTEAIQRTEPNPFVWVRDSQNKAQKRIVTLGLEGLLTVEVSSGLRPGEQVVLPSPELPLEPGMPIIPQTGPLPESSPSHRRS